MSGTVKKLLTVGAAASALMLATAGTSYAADALNAYEPAGAESWGNVEWFNNGNSVRVTGYHVRDVECDGNQVYTQVFIKEYTGNTRNLRTDRKSDGCGQKSLSDLTWHAGGRPFRLWLTVCEDNWGGDDCSDSRISDNPFG